MNGRVGIILVAGAVVLAGGVAVFLFTQPANAPAVVTPPKEPATPPPVTPPVATAPASKHTPMQYLPEPAPAVAEAPKTGTLKIEVDVPATVFLDRKFLGDAPVTIPNVAPGTHHINVAATGYDGVSEDIQVEAGVKTLAFALKDKVRLDVKIEVVHKHGVGSCKGQLLATGQGLRYETANTADAFVTTLQKVESFEVNSTDKVLKIKVDGRTYNFADAGGDVTRLTGFHDTVEKARQKR